MNPATSIIIPVHNEEDNLDILYKEIRTSLDKLEKPYEIIFIDDGSCDKSFERLKKIKQRELAEGDTFSQTRLIKFTRNFGQTAAMQAGFDQSKGDVVVSLDGDLQNDPNDIPRLIHKLNEGYNMVCGWRKDRKDKTITRIVPSKVANWLIAKITGVPIHDNGCSLKAYDSSMVKSIRIYSDMHRFIPAIMTTKGAKIAEIIVNHRHRKYGKTKYGLTRIWKVFFDIITIKMLIHFNDRPMLWFGVFSFLFLLFGLGMGMASFIFLPQWGNFIVFPAASFLFLSLFGSLFSWGLLAEFFLKVEKRIHLTQMNTD